MPHLADELGRLREEIRALKARETEIQKDLERAGTGIHAGRFWLVRVERGVCTRIDTDRLPEDIRNDPSYQRTEPRLLFRSRRIGGHHGLPIDDPGLPGAALVE